MMVIDPKTTGSKQAKMVPVILLLRFLSSTDDKVLKWMSKENEGMRKTSSKSNSTSSRVRHVS